MFGPFQRVDGLVVLACLALSGCAATGSAGVRERARPNILFIFADDHACQAVGAYGSKINQTPNLDRLANQGMRFTHCFVSNAICAPSRASLLTGKFSHLNGVKTNREVFDGSQPTLPKLLQATGYQTALIGKWHLKSDPTGFDHWEVLIGQGPYYNPPMKTPAGVVKYQGYTTDIITDRTLDWLNHSRDSSRPFLLMYQHKAPHREWQPPPELLGLYDDVTIPEPESLFDDYAGRASGARTQAMTIAEHLTALDLKLTPPTNLTDSQLAAWRSAYEPQKAAFEGAAPQGRELVRWKYQRFIKDYLRAVASLDQNLGRVLDYLSASGLSDNTVVIYSSDQGFFLGEHGWFDKRWMYEESFRVPLLVRWPGMVKPGSVNQDLVQNVDFAPTMLDMVGAAVPSDMQGRSLVPLLKGRTPRDWRQAVYYHYFEHPGEHNVPRHFGIRTQRYKLIRYYELGECELFDLQQDPQELRSVFADRFYASVVEELKGQLAAMRRAYGDHEGDETAASAPLESAD